MAKTEETSKPSPKDEVISKYKRIKDHVRKNKMTYVVGAAGVVLTTVTFVVTRRVYAPTFLGKVVIKDSVLWIQTYTRWNGPPSWVIRCVENDDIFTSQADAARRMGLSASRLSSHLNGKTEHVKGYHFKRVAMATPRSG